MVKVGQWLAHPHDHDVRQSLLHRQQVAQPDQLFNDLTGTKIPGHAVEPAGTKDTSHAAADLSADASGVPIGLLDQDALDELTVVKSEEQLVRAVGRLRVMGN